MNARQRALLERTLRLRNANDFISTRLRVGNRDLSEQRRVREIVRTEDDNGGAAIGLECTIAGKLPESVEFNDVVLDVVVGGVPVRRFTGEAEMPEVRGSVTTLRAHTAGYWLDKVKLNSFTQYALQQPEVIAHDLLTRAPYDKSRIDIMDAMLPKFQASITGSARDTGFMPFQSLAEPLAALTNEAGYAFRDTPWNGVTARVPPARPQSVEWDFELGPDELVLREPAAESEGKFSHVMVFRVDDDPTNLSQIEELTLPIRVPGSRAPDDAWLWIEVSDTTLDALRAGLLRAHEEVDRMTGIRRLGEWSSRVINPLLTRGSTVAIRQRDWDDEGHFVRFWVGELTSVRDTYGGRAQNYGAELYLVREDRILPSRPRPRGRTGTIRRPALGTDHMGRFYMREDLPFVTRVDAWNLDIDVAVAAAMGITVTVDPLTNQIELLTSRVGG